MPASSSLRRSTSSPRYHPLPDEKSFRSSSRDFPRISVAFCSWSFVATLPRASAFDSGFHTTAILVPARFNHASLTPGFRLSSKRIGLARLPQPICGAARHCNGTLKKLTVLGGVRAGLLSLVFLFITIHAESFTLSGNEAR